MNVLFAVSECMPFISTGGLAEVSGSLPKELKKLGVNLKIIMPLYKRIYKKYSNELTLVGETITELAWRKQYCGLYTIRKFDIDYYFVDNKFYFDREELYSHYDDGERFAFFSKSIFECLKLMQFHPHIIHCHDHQTALITIYLDLMKKQGENLDIKTVFTIHNIEYQGVYDSTILGDVFGIEEKYLEILQYNGSINLLKGAIVCSDLVTTVSPNYAKEITTAEYASGLHHIINANKKKIVGILNGIDYHFYNSFTDEVIFKKFNLDTLASKVENKRALQKAFDLKHDDNTCIICVISRLASHKGIELIISKLDEMMQLNIQLVILGVGEQQYEDTLRQYAQKYKGRIYAIFAFDTNLAKQIYSSSDFLLMPSKTEPCGLSQMIACRYGTIPIVRATGGLYDSIKSHNGFVFKKYDANHMMNKIKEAVKIYHNNKEKLNVIIKNAYLSDFTWQKSADAYLKEYLKLV